ncbi:MAG: DUF554 domain-containing protein [Muribaculaceae bacterium]|nr:DUF554 domain-containing protein [Muribaculaceae bacterium]
MFGTIVNTVMIIAGTAVGALLRSRLSERLRDAVMMGMGLITLVLGANMAITNLSKSEYPVLFIVSIAAGVLIGTWIDIDGQINRAAERRNASHFVQGLTTACLLYCIGTLSIVGPVMSATIGDNTMLFTNATLDFFSSIIFAASFGWGIMWGAAVLFCWQGAIWLLAKLAGSSFAIPEAMLSEVALVGGVLLLSSGLAILKIKDCRTVNLLPALAVPVVFYIVKNLIW